MKSSRDGSIHIAIIAAYKWASGRVIKSTIFESHTLKSGENVKIIMEIMLYSIIILNSTSDNGTKRAK